MSKIYPLNRLPREAVELLMPGLRVRVFQPGTEVFAAGSTPDDLYYVLQGSVALSGERGTRPQTIGPDDMTPIPHAFPSAHRATAVNGSKLLAVDRKRLMDLLRQYHPSTAQAMEWACREPAAPASGEGAASERTGLSPLEPGLNDWQRALLRAPGFQRIAADDMRRAFALMRPVHYSAGDVVIEQGDPAAHFYVVAEGRCEVLRAPMKGDNVTRVAEYGPGATLGEDGLVSGNLRNATVRMLTDGLLMQLDGDDFRFLIKRALVRGVDAAEAREMVARGSRWLDVRLPQERKAELAGAMAIPHPIVRGRLFTANPQQSYVVVCARGFDASVVAFMLCKYGFDAYFVKGGFAELQKAEKKARRS